MIAVQFTQSRMLNGQVTFRRFKMMLALDTIAKCKRHGISPKFFAHYFLSLLETTYQFSSDIHLNRRILLEK